MHLDHEHSHEHSHGHSHDNCCGGAKDDCCDHEEASGASAKDLALLKYMLNHNKEHARELSDIGARISGSGAGKAAKQIDDAVHYFDHANESLEKAISLVKDGE